MEETWPWYSSAIVELVFIFALKTPITGFEAESEATSKAGESVDVDVGIGGAGHG